jgi:hypothetical protein
MMKLTGRPGRHRRQLPGLLGPRLRLKLLCMVRILHLKQQQPCMYKAGRSQLCRDVVVAIHMLCSPP